MKIAERFSTGLLILSMVVLLAYARISDWWLRVERARWETTLSERSRIFVLWGRPVIILIFGIAVLGLSRYVWASRDKIAVIVYLVVGLAIIFYVPIEFTFHTGISKVISLMYFGNTLLTYSGAFLAGIGIIGMMTRKNAP